MSSLHYDHHQIHEVAIDVKVVLQIVKHAQDDEKPHEFLCGFLSGFSKDGVTEVTNSFRNISTSDLADEDQSWHVGQMYQSKMLKRLRENNQDHIIVGMYKKIKHLNFMNKPDDLHYCIQFQQINDLQCNGTVILVYDENRMTNGDYGIRAFRVSEKAMKMWVEHQNVSTPSTRSHAFAIGNIKKHGLSFNEIIEEVPVTIKSSPLMNCFLHQIETDRLNAIERTTTTSWISGPQIPKYGNQLMAPAFNIASTSHLQEQSELMKDSIEELQNDTNKFLTNQRSLMKATASKYQIISQRERDNEEREKNGEKQVPVDTDEIDRIVKMPEEFNQLPGIVHTYQASLFCESVKNLSSGNVGKLFLAESMQN